MGNWIRSISWEAWIALCVTVTVCITRLSMAAGQIFYVLSIVLGLAYVVKHRKDICIDRNIKVMWCLYGIMLLFFIPSVLMSRVPLMSLKEWGNVWIYKYLLFLIIPLCIRSQAILYKMLAVFLVVTGIDCWVAFVQPLVLHVKLDRGWGFGSNTLTIAGIMTMVLPINIIAILDTVFPSYVRRSAIFGLVSVFFGMYGNKSRSTWLISLLSVPLALVTYVKTYKKVVLTLLAVFVIALGAFWAQPQFQERIHTITNTTTDTSNLGRIYAIESSFKMLHDHPITGIGIGQWKHYYAGKYNDKRDIQHVVHSHNNFVQVLCETGYVGFFGFCLFVFGVFWQFLRIWRNGSSPFLWCAIWIFASYYILFGQIEYSIDNSSGIRIMWFLMAVMLQLHSLRKSNT